ncbi:MAG: hypothetical protein IPG71_03560 [bacterium]|nr:hypothetical protein [bacterium]
MFLTNKFRFGLIALILTLATGLFLGCEEDDDNDGNPPVTGTLTGTLLFHGDWPDSGAVQVSVFENWNINAGNCSWCVNAAGGPPAYYTHQGYLVDPDPANAHDVDTLQFEITGVSLGTYNSIVTGWRAPEVTDITCDEPIVGMYGGDPFANDSLPTAVSFTESAPTQDITLHTYFDYFLPVPGCDERGRIAGDVNLTGDYPAAGLLVMLTAFPVSGWQPVIGAPTDYDFVTAADTHFEFRPAFGTYYVSLWTNAQPPASAQWYGSYGLDTQISPSHPLVANAHPTSIVLNETQFDHNDLEVNGYAPAPHYISGSVTYTGTRPNEGLLVLVTTFPVSPEQPPMGQPLAYFRITDPSETLYAFSGLAEGTYYVSLWNNVQGPGATCYGAYGYTSGE